jgi:molybdopterin molybdotransferase
MISLEEAQARLFALREPVELEHVPLVDAVGRWAAEDVVARRTQPARDLSAMDGYAVRASDAPGPWAVIGESAAGQLFVGMVRSGEAVRIFTGAAMPPGADSVLIQENAERKGDVLTLSAESPVAGRHVRREGADFPENALLVKVGERWTPPRIALAAMGGHGILPVRRRLRVALISTGDELVAPGQPCAEHQIPSSNAAMLATMLAGLPVDVDDRGVVRDDLAALAAEFSACSGHDIVVSMGGASVGDHDLVRPALAAAGARLENRDATWKTSDGGDARGSGGAGAAGESRVGLCDGDALAAAIGRPSERLSFTLARANRGKIGNCLACKWRPDRPYPGFPTWSCGNASWGQ